MGPIEGYWRSSNQSSNFIACLYKPACLGMISPDFNPQGTCDAGYQGILCADCQPNFTRSRDYQCTKCESLWWSYFRIFLIVFVVLLLVFILTVAQSKSRYLHVYLRHLIDHIQ